MSHSLIDTLSATYQILSTDYYAKDKKPRSPHLGSSTGSLSSSTGSLSSSPARAHAPPLALGSTPPSSGSLTRLPHTASPTASVREMYTPTRFRPYWICNMTGTGMEYEVEAEVAMDDTHLDVAAVGCVDKSNYILGIWWYTPSRGGTQRGTREGLSH